MTRTLALVISAMAVAGGLVVCFSGSVAARQQQQPRFGGGYASLDVRRQALVNDWVGRFARTTGQAVEPAQFYDDMLSLSTKTTFDAVTHALMTTQLTDPSGADLADALTLVERIESVRGERANAASDRQFRIYVSLMPGAVNTLRRAQQFKRGADNTFFHKGYPASYREQGGVPSVQISIATDDRRADIDVDYRSSSFPLALFNGHLSSANSDVRAGNNYERHIGRWGGFRNWWRSFFGVREDRAPELAETTHPQALPTTPRIGHTDIAAAVNDFLRAWLVEGDVVAAMGSISERSYACLAEDSDDPASFDRGMVPFQLMMNLKEARDSLGEHTSLEGLVVGTRLTLPGLRVVKQAHHAQFVVYSVRDDVANEFDCQSQLTLAGAKKVPRSYGTYYGSTFVVDGQRDYSVALLWAQENRYWKIVSWRIGSDTAIGPNPETVPSREMPRGNADPALARSARDFLESWLIRRDYGAAFDYIAPEAYGCYNLERGASQPASVSPEDARRRLRANLEVSGTMVGGATSLQELLSPVEPVHPATRILNHPFERIFTLTSPPNALADAMECTARAEERPIPDPMPLEYGNGYGLTVRFRTAGGDPPVLRLLWRRRNGIWRITSYDIVVP
jgi:hypothetical protein